MAILIFGVFVVTALILFGLAAWMFNSARGEKTLWNQLQQQGVVTEAEITERLLKGQTVQAALMLLSLLTSSRAHGSNLHHAVVFKFEVPDGERKKIYTVERPIGVGSALKVGDKVTVHYLPTAPTTARLSTEKTQGRTIQIMAGFIVLLGVLSLVFGVSVAVGSDRQEAARYASSTAYALKLSATPNTLEKTGTANAVATSIAQDETALALIRADFDDKLPEWQKVTDLEPHRLDAEVKNFLWVDYGYCKSGKFYAMFWRRITDRITINNVLSVYYAGYGYYKGTTPDECYPNSYAQVWSRRQNPDLGGGWFAIQGAREIKLSQ